jgi:hypothetical protein
MKGDAAVALMTIRLSSPARYERRAEYVYNKITLSVPKRSSEKLV